MTADLPGKVLFIPTDAELIEMQKRGELPSDVELVRVPVSDDEFYGGVWWLPSYDGHLRVATVGECSDEIRRLRSLLAEFRHAR